jgi:hypothetical protein
VSVSRLAPLILAVALAGCSATATAPRAPVAGVGDLAGAWTGWLITSRDTLPATLDIDRDGTFTLAARGVRVAGTVTVRDGAARFDAGGVWHGTLSLRRNDGRCLLQIARADGLLPGRVRSRTAG